MNNKYEIVKTPAGNYRIRKIETGWMTNKSWKTMQTAKEKLVWYEKYEASK